jgi:ABC-type bacteriocin/lantibiotic exporter with double-glycine peptidase domain
MVSTNGEGVRYSKIEGNADHALRRLGKALESGPAMAAMNGKGFGAGEGHWIVITGHENNELRYLDPWFPRRTERSLSATEFRKHWDDFGFFLIHPCNCKV